MSFTRFAIRRSALYALKGATLVGDNVRDSDFSAIDIGADGSLRTPKDRPFVLVYTDDSTAEEAEMRDLRQNGELDVVCEFGIATAMTETNEKGESVIIGVNVPATDDFLEMTLDMVDRQIVAALTDPRNSWAQLWEGMIWGVLSIERRRAASTDDGVRIAARQLRIKVKAFADPVWGQPLPEGSVWEKFLAALEDEDATLAEVAQGFLGPQDGALTYEHIQRSRGHTSQERRALGYGPADDENPAATITGWEIDDA